MLTPSGTASTWSPPPPYAFMKGARLWFVEPRARAVGDFYYQKDTFETTYAMSRPMDQVLTDARAELSADWMMDNDLGGFRAPNRAFGLLGRKSTVPNRSRRLYDDPDLLKADGYAVVVISSYPRFAEWHLWKRPDQYPALPMGTQCFVTIILKPTVEAIVRWSTYRLRWPGWS
jgi:hypothetical protein